MRALPMTRPTPPRNLLGTVRQHPSCAAVVLPQQVTPFANGMTLFLWAPFGLQSRGRRHR